ncbi:MAG TPA: hypothetical protein PKW95_05955 [bacterium]|nr:hypothetical protein [bacterium]
MRKAWAAPLLVTALALVLLGARLGSWAFFSTAPLYQENYPKYFYQSDQTARFIAETGVFWGYDPTFAAGLLLNPGATIIAHNLPSLIGAATGWPAAVTIKTILLLFFVAFPWLTYAAARRFGLGPFAAAGAMLATVLMNFFSLRYSFIRASMGMYFSATPLLFYALALLATAREKPWRWPPVLFAAGTLLCWWHIEQGLLFFFAAFVLLLRGRRTLARPLPLIGMAAATIGAAALNWSWLGPFVRFHLAALPFNAEIFVAFPVDWHGSGGLVFLMVALLQPLILLALAASPWRKRLRDELPAPLRDLAALAVLLMSIVAAMSLVRILTGFFPTRLLDVLPPILFVLAGWRIERTPNRQRFAYGAAAALAAQLVLFYALFPHQPFVNEPPATYRELAGWLRENTDDRARIALEASGRPDRQPLGVDPSSLLAYDVPRQYVALPSTESANVLYQAYLLEGRLGAHDLTTLGEAAHRRLLAAYNIGWVVAYSERLKQALHARPALYTPLRTIDCLEIFGVEREPSWFLAGSGKVAAARNRLRLSDLVPDEQGRIVLAYHYYDSLSLRGAGQLRRQRSPLDGFGFIELRDVAGAAEIVNDPSRPMPTLPLDYFFLHGPPP